MVAEPNAKSLLLHRIGKGIVKAPLGTQLDWADALITNSTAEELSQFISSLDKRLTDEDLHPSERMIAALATLGFFGAVRHLYCPELEIFSRDEVDNTDGEEQCNA